jgi:hemerythrin-like domain-containing protein
MMTRTSQPDPALARAIERDHVSIREAVRQLRDEIARLRAAPGLAPSPGKLGGMLGMFRVHLARHFALEEQGRLLGNVAVARDAGMQHTVEDLIADHRGFERTVGRLLDAARRAESGDADLTGMFATSLEGFLDDLDRHEHAENDLVGELSNRAIGVGGGAPPARPSVS